ncbi:MAG: hypothetical protein R3A78_06030 [Polyangiales bacterium]|nr:hypothetical protein [Myxococcales bacterium]
MPKRTWMTWMLGLSLVGAVGCGSSSHSGNLLGDDGGKDGGDSDADGSEPDAGHQGGTIPDGGKIDMCDEGGRSFFYVMRVLDIGTNAWVKENVDANAANNVIPGLNLDATDNSVDYVSAGMSPCGKRQDFVYPSATSPAYVGIDNRAAVFLADVSGLANIDVSKIIADAIHSGELLLLVKLNNVDIDVENPEDETYFPEDDACVNLDILIGGVPAETELAFDEGGLLTAGQTFDTKLSSYEAGKPVVQIFGAKIKDGRLRGGTSTKLPVELPTEGSATIDLAIENAKFEFDVNATAISNGVLGGTLNVNTTAQTLATYANIQNAIVKAALAGHADINPNATGTQCQDISIGLVYDGVDAVEGIQQ